MRTPRLVATAGELEEMMPRLMAQPIIAVDTESDSFHHYFEKVCLIQLSTPEDDLIIDPLALGDDTRRLGPLFSSGEVEVVLHDAGYDIICLRRDFGFQPHKIFDTMLASRLLGLRRFGLAAVLEERFGVHCDKRHQRSDWSRRPLSEAQLRYAQQDTAYLIELRNQLHGELEAAGRLDIALEEFERLCSKSAPQRVADPDAFFHIKNARTLAPKNLGVLRDLHRLRERSARHLDQPVFKVLTDDAMMAIATSLPSHMSALLRLRGVTRRVVSRLGSGVLQVVRDAQPETRTPPARKRRRAGRSLQPRARKIFDRLRAWRVEQAEGWGLEPEVLVSNATLEQIAQDPPASREELCAIEELAGWRADGLVTSIMEHLGAAGDARG